MQGLSLFPGQLHPFPSRQEGQDRSVSFRHHCPRGPSPEPKEAKGKRGGQEAPGLPLLPPAPPSAPISG